MEPTTYKLELTFDEIMQTGNALAELPYKHVSQVLQKIAAQVEAQKKQREDELESERNRNR